MNACTVIYFRHYDQAPEDSLPDIIRECQDFLRSEEMFLTLSNLMGLTLHQLAVGNNSDSESEPDNSAKNTPGGSTVSSEASKTKDKSLSPSDDLSEKSKPLKKRRRIEEKNTDDDENEEMETKEKKG
jgi:hypothetical protein